MRSFVSFSILASLICVAFLALPEWVFAQETKEPLHTEMIVTGRGQIVDENIAEARNEAISQAFSMAVEEYLVQKLGPLGVANNFQRLYEEILSKAKEQIQDYQIIKELTTNKYVTVLIKARVNAAVVEAMLEDMRVSERDTIQIDVLFLVSERGPGSSESGWWTDPFVHTSLSLTEILLSQVFEDKGFRVINRSFFPLDEIYDKGMLRIRLTDEDAVTWGKMLSAQVVITGEATISSGESRASVYLKALGVEDGITIAQGFREGKQSGVQENEKNAIESAINEWAHDMVPYIVNAFKPSEKAVKQIIVVLKGLKSYKELHDIKEFFTGNFPEIKSAIESRLKREFVSVSIKLQGESRDLARRALHHPKKPFLFDISEVSEQGFTVVRK
jgi:isochorismate hydrolase